MPESTKIEFAVQMTCNSCVDAVKKCLENTPRIRNFDINLQKTSVIVDTDLPTLDVQKQLESTGLKVVLRGYGGQAGVAILDTGEKNVQGVVRFVQSTPGTCVIDGTVDGLAPGKEYLLEVHEAGDISQGCDSVGDVLNLPTCTKRVYGNLGTIQANNEGRASSRLEDKDLKLSHIIGRSLVVADNNKRLVCGVIARSAGLFENPKTICACDGVSIWDEKNKPKAAVL